MPSVCPCHLVAVLLHAKVRAAMFHKHVGLHEGLGVQKEIHSLPGSQLTLRHKNPFRTLISQISARCLSIRHSFTLEFSIKNILFSVFISNSYIFKSAVFAN